MWGLCNTSAGWGNSPGRDSSGVENLLVGETLLVESSGVENLLVGETLLEESSGVENLLVGETLLVEPSGGKTCGSGSADTGFRAIERVTREAFEYAGEKIGVDGQRTCLSLKGSVCEWTRGTRVVHEKSVHTLRGVS